MKRRWIIPPSFFSSESLLVFSRAVRVLTAIAVVAGTALFGLAQWRLVSYNAEDIQLRVQISSRGVFAGYRCMPDYGVHGLQLFHFDPPPLSLWRLWLVPNFNLDGYEKTVFIPWWLILLLAGVIAGLAWRVTRQRNPKAAFPVEVTQSKALEEQTP